MASGDSFKGQALLLQEFETELLRDLRYAAHSMLQEQERLVKGHLKHFLELRQQPDQDDIAGAATEPPGPAPKPLPAVRSPRFEQELEPVARRPALGISSTKLLDGVPRSWKASFRSSMQGDAEKAGGGPRKGVLVGGMARLYKWLGQFREPERSGPLARVVLSDKFEMLTLAMIMLNGALIFWQTDANARVASTERHLLHDGFSPGAWDSIFELFFILFFVVELILKLLVHHFYFFWNDDMWWNIFDAVTVVSAASDMAINLVAEAGDGPDITFLRVLRIFRLIRSVRMLRALHFIKSLRQLVDCIVASFIELFWCMVLLIFLTGLFAVFLVQVATNYWMEPHMASEMSPGLENDGLVSHFSSVNSAMLSLLMCTTGGQDWGYFYDILRPTGVVGVFLLTAYVLFFIVAAWNLVTSLFIEKALTLAQPDMEEQILVKRRQDLSDAKILLQIIQSIDIDRSGTISLHEFQSWMTDPSFRAFFEVRNIDIKDAELFFHMLEAAADREDVDISLVVDGLMRMRGVASNLDLQMINFQNMVFHKHVDKRMTALQMDVQNVASNAAFVAKGKTSDEEQLPRICQVSAVAGSGKRSQALEVVQNDIELLNFAGSERAVHATPLVEPPLKPDAVDDTASTSVSKA